MRKFKTCQALIFSPQTLAVSGGKPGAQGKLGDAAPAAQRPFGGSIGFCYKTG
jgi:hypothetical protein